MRDNLNAALKKAMKAQEKRRMGTLRLINAAIKDRDIAARSHGEDGVSDKEILEILARMVKQRRETIVIYEEAGRLELAQQEEEEIAVIEDFLPKQLSDDETKSAVGAVLKELECSGLKDMGRAMGTLKERYSGQMDFSKASKLVKDHLG